MSFWTVEEGLADDRVQDLLEDGDGILWIATLGGISRFDGSRFHCYTIADGLPNNHVRCICQDRRGRLWFGTDGGAVVYDGQVFQTVHTDCVVPITRIIEDREGRLWFATQRGAVRYAPGGTPPRVRVIQVISDQVFREPTKVEVSIGDRQVIFEYKGMSFRTPPRQMRYVCRLQGYEEEWRPATRSLRAQYSGLPPGEYTFQVRAVDRDLNYSEPATVQLSVVPDPRLEALTEALSRTADEFVGDSSALREIEVHLAEAAPTDLTVLILGETGTGKGLAAHTLHGLSPRRSSPFIPVNCGAIPESLVESELFGHERGAFTGAISRKLGKVELAEGGTLFLDEIGDLASASQAKLLRFLEERTFERVGGTQSLQADVRVIAATNRDLSQMVEAGEFREDLYFRLQVFPIEMPPLRERREDIPVLAYYFMERMADHLNKPVSRLTPDALRVLQAYDWPGNVRELEHAVQRAVIVCPGAVIRAEDIVLELVRTEGRSGQEPLTLEEVERRHILQVLEQTGWVIAGRKGAAAVLGLARSTLQSRMRKLGIVRPQAG